MFSSFFQYAKAKSPRAPHSREPRALGEERMRGAFRDACQAWRKAYARVQLVMPSVVAIAVKMLMAIWMRVFQVSFFIVIDV